MKRPAIQGLIIACTLAGFALSYQVPEGTQAPTDLQGYGPIKWGMTVNEAKAVVGDRASEPEEKLPGKVRLVDRIIVRNLEVAGTTAKAAIQSTQDSEKISAVTLNFGESHDLPAAREEKYGTLKSLLTQKYGNPRSDTPAARTASGAYDQTATWTFPSTTITLRCLQYREERIGFLSIEYKAVNKEATRGL